MRCLAPSTYSRSPVETDLAEALRPETSWVREHAAQVGDAVGRLLAALVEREVFTVEEAAEIAGVQGVRSLPK